jgi:hypothetical protein
MNKQEPDTATKINELHESLYIAIRKPIQIAIQLGELLTAQKERCGHGDWTSWIKANLKFSADTAGRYMRCYSNREKLTDASNHLTINEFLRSLSETSNSASMRNMPTQDFVPPRMPRHVNEALARVTAIRAKVQNL